MQFVRFFTAVMLIGASVSSHAGFIMQLNGNGAPALVIEDNGAGDVDGREGAILFTGSFGGFDMILGGVSAPVSGTKDAPNLGSVSVYISNGSGHLQVNVLDDGFTGPLPKGRFETSINATNGFALDGGQVSTFLLDGNGIDALSVLDIPAATNTYDLADIATVTDILPGFALSMDVLLNFGSQNAAGTRFDATIKAVPEPATLSLLVLGLFGLGLARRARASS